MSAAKRIDTIVSAVLQQTARQQRPLFMIQRRWGQLVGKALAAHTRPVSLRRGRLVVYVEQPGDGYALNYQRPALLKRLQATTKGRVEEIVIRPGELSPRTTEAQHLSVGRKENPRSHGF